MSINQAKKIYCLGIGGIGVSGLARLFLSMGKEVSGSDLKQTQITNDLIKLGAKITVGPNQKSFNGFDLLIYSNAVPEADLANISIPKLSHGQAIGELMEGKYGIGVTGTNGKSTTTALLGLILEKANMDLTVLVGSLLSPKNETEKFRGNARLGQSQFFVTESDEYARKMLLNKPKMIVITNIAEDHMDFYKTLADIKSAFLEYIKALPQDGILIYNADDHNAVEVCKHATCHKFTFGIHHYADLQAVNRVQGTTGSGQVFDMHYDDEMIGKFELPVPGLFNISNALGAALAAIKLGVKPEVIKKSLAEYVGLWRRFEKVGELNGKPVISDYAHHPAGLAATIQAAQEFYPGKKILIVFQPHQRNRTKSLFEEFVNALANVQEVIIPEIFDVPGREHGEDISSKQIVHELNKMGTKASFAKDLAEAGELIKEKVKDFDVVLMLGAGDIDDLARKLVE
jgi:UDP-N-acetylmuramate--alanine ligase